MKRREFIIKGSVATAALSTSAVALGNVIDFKNANDTLTIGIIGTGDRGTGMISNINKIDKFNVSACCDVLPFRLEKGLKAVKGKAKGYDDYRRLLDNKAIDAILVSTPFSTHSQIAMDALDAGKHVYCEKTMAKGYEGIDQLAQKVNQSNTIFQTGHQYHSSRLYTHVVDLIKNGKIGKIASFECQWNRHGDWRRMVPRPELERAINWRMYREYSGGLLAELCSHQIDFANWVLDEVPQQVMGAGGVDYWKDGRETFDNIHLIYSYPSGVKATFTCLTSNAKDGYKIRVKGDKGSIILEYAKAWFYPEGNEKKEIGVLDGVSGATLKWEEGLGIPIDMEHLEPSEQALIDFRDSIVSNTNPISDIVTGANTAICIQMGLDAMYNNTIVSNPKL
ncbi:Gfo/Idh/MocA family oxidoreductase [Cellulophaga sp. E16_2]|uniref:Gfo/Idh/MocA family protein n=1 Tax=unclassified Cellulophaga TaxID=2634405 RepID=UPI0013FD71C5|nr:MULTISPECIES: Gfo/Idh/MocA family oxidoreductase [unclassified Cellulophaga]MBO0590209.1 Gfo/Idh/MocA family oxidoreductase [Cellulophaga sp. E16_2]